MKTTLLLLTACILTGCASVSVSSRHENPDLAPTKLPTKITVLPTKAVFVETSGPRQGPPSETLYLEVGTGHARAGTAPVYPATGNALSTATAKQMARFIGPHGGKPQELIIESRITAHERGSRALRTIVGLGFGKTLLETKTVVFNPNKSKTDPWLEVWTTGSSNREPGAVFAAMPSPLLAFNILAVVGTTASIANGSGKGLTQDAKRTGKLIGSYIIERLDASGRHIENPPSVKYLHSVPVPLTNKTVDVPFTKKRY